jgi:hypothetical protein
MPINLRYGQQAVARGFLNKQRLDQVLAKQKALEAQGKKVSIRMILEKAKLLSEDQLNVIDRDLNIKVVKKHTAQIQKPGVRKPTGPTGAQNFAGEAVPQFSGMSGADPDATVFSPPPADMQAKIKAERDRAKAQAKQKQEQEASAFFGNEDASPFGGDPFGGGGGDMAPEPFGNEMQPEPFGGEMQPEAFGGEMQPEPFGGGGYGEMQPEPFGGGDLSPEPMGFGDDSGGFGGEPQELSRMDSSPKLSSLQAEYDNFANPEDEALPTIGAFDEAPPARGGYGAPPARQDFGGPALAPAGDDFDSFGNDFRSPEEMEMSAPGKPGAGDVDATMFSPPPPGIGGPKSPRQKTGAMDRTVFSPRPPEFGGHQPEEMQPAADDWGEQEAPAPSFEEEPVSAGMDATLFSPPPSSMPAGRKDAGRKDTSRQPKGRQGADDFGDIEIPKGRQIDDVPTAPASMEDEVHPLRRGVGTSSAPIKQRPTTRPVPTEDEVADELPEDVGVGVDVPDETGQIADEEPLEAAPPVGKGKGKLPGKAPREARESKRELPQKEVPATGTAVKEKKGAGKRVLLIFTFLLAVVIAVLVLPIVLFDSVPQMEQIRNHKQAKPIYDYVDYEIMDEIRKLLGQKTHRPPKPVVPIPLPLPDNTEQGSSNEESAGDNTAE